MYLAGFYNKPIFDVESQHLINIFYFKFFQKCKNFHESRLFDFLSF